MSGGWVECEMCGLLGMPTEIATRLHEWAAPDASHPRYGTMTRCHDAQACRNRLEDQGKPWPIVDRTAPRPTPAMRVVSPPAAELPAGDEWLS
jgi:hypothetical protein